MGRGRECGCGRCSKRSWGAWAGDVAGDLGVRARVRACWSTAGCGEGGADRGVPWRSERERVRGETVRRADEAGSRGREGEEHTGEGNRRRQSGPTGQRERGEKARAEGKHRCQVEPSCQAARARAAPLDWTRPVWAALDFSTFLEFLIVFYFFFSRVFNSNSN
jgi:hypothetical protein